MNRRAACGFALALCAIGASPPPSIELRNANDPANRIEARAQLDAARLERLSDEVRLTLSVEGPGPLRVTLPKPLLTKANIWRLRDDGLPLREVLPGGREKWTQVYHLSPLVPGSQVVSLGPLTIRAGSQADLSLAWDETRLPVVDVAEPKVVASVESLRPPTDIEAVPLDSPIEARSSGWLFAVVPILLILSAIGIALGRRKKPPVAPRDAAWALGELAAVDLTADRCALVLRQYLGFWFAVPTEFQTTPELARTLRADDRLPADIVADWRVLLDECDAARFSGTAASVAGLADRARALVAGAEASKQHGHEVARKDTKIATSV